MSIKDYIAEINGDQIHFLPNTVLHERCIREVFVNDALNSALAFEEHADEVDSILFARARQALDSFSAGRTIAIRFPPSKRSTAQLALLDPKSREIWNFRIKDPNPGLRIFGRFAAKDCFVALHYAKRDELQKPKGWEKAENKCIQQWRLIFPTFKPLSGETRDDYLSNSVEV